MPKWRKQGRIFHLEHGPNRSTHAQVPTVLVKNDVLRIYYACRENGKSFPTFFDIDRKNFDVVRAHGQRVMDLGKPGMFDSDGIMPSCVIENNAEIWLYYIGWNARAEGARYQNEIGIAVSKDGGETFERMFPGPIMGRSPTEPGLAVMPFVMKDHIFKMWYQSGTAWHLINGKYEPTYVIKCACSIGGINWDRLPNQCVPSHHPLEAFSRPAIIKKDNIWHQYYCYRDSEEYRGGKGSYRIGYATSDYGINFERHDSEAGITLGESGDWDSEMQCYPAIVQVDGKTIMFYNGNGFGQTGIGWAILDE